MYPSLFQTFLIAIPTVSAALESVERASCAGAQQGDYCCQGLILQKDHNGGTGADNLICCQGDSSIAINFAASAPTSCTAGTQIPLTEAGGSSQSTAIGAAASSPIAEATSANSGSRAMIIGAPLIGAAVLAGEIFNGI